MLDGNKPLLEPMLTQIYVVIWHHCFKLKARYGVSFDSSNSALCPNSAAPVIHGTSFHNACSNKTLLFKQGWVVLISLTQIYSYIAIAISVGSIWYWFTLSHKCPTLYFNNIINSFCLVPAHWITATQLKLMKLDAHWIWFKIKKLQCSTYVLFVYVGYITGWI